MLKNRLQILSERGERLLNIDGPAITSSNSNTSISWWTTVAKSDAYDLKHILKSVASTNAKGQKTFPLLQSLRAIYICCNAFNITHTEESHPVTYIRERQ